MNLFHLVLTEQNIVVMLLSNLLGGSLKIQALKLLNISRYV